MKYREILSKAAELLKDRGIVEYDSDAWILFEHVFHMKRHEYIMKMNDEIAENKSIDYFRNCLEMRTSHVPVQYITGSTEFMGLKFNVDENVLIPRQDTEILVENALKIIRQKKDVCKSDETVQVMDMCTGSGCIAISVSVLGDVDVTAVDISYKALKIATENAVFNGADRVKFIESNLFDKINENISGNNTGECGTMGACPVYDVIISNPPYIPSKVIEGLKPEVRDHEPRLALDGTEDGLEFYRRITEQSVRYIKPGGYLMYEIGCEQGDSVRKLMTDTGYEDVRIIRDLAGLDRVVMGMMKP